MTRTIQRYQVLAELGHGGMGTVYLATDPRLDREVAIKVLDRPQIQAGVLTTNATVDLRTRPSRPDDLLSEARMMARLSHPNVLPIYEAGLDEDRVFFVMEYIAGENLRVWLEQPRRRGEILDVLAQAARGLAAAHDRGIVHRDFKPDNVLIGRDGRVRVADFGLANLVMASELIQAETARGTPRYMAPELFHDGAATPCSDVFALCRTIAEAFGGADDPRRATGIPDRLRACVEAGLHEDPTKRPSISEVIDELREPVRRRWVWVGGATALGSAAIATAWLMTARVPSCDSDHVLDKRWDPAIRDALDHSLTRSPREAAQRVATLIDERASQIVTLSRAACRALAVGELGGPQADIQQSCLERRAIELGLAIEHAVGHTDADAARIEMVVFDTPLPAECTEVTEPAIHDRSHALELHRQLDSAADLAPDAAASALTSLEQTAKAAGEDEVEIGAEIGLAEALRRLQRLPEADQTLERAYANAVAIASTSLQASVLSRRTSLANAMAQPAAVESYAKLAFALVDHPNLHPRSRVAIYSAMAMSALVRGDPKAAIPMIRSGLEIAKVGRPMPDLEYRLRLEQVIAVMDTEGAIPSTVAFVRDSAEWTRVHFGEHLEYATMLSNAASTLAEWGDPEAAIDARRRAVAIDAKELGATALDTLDVSERLGADLVAAGRFGEARDHLQALIADCERAEPGRRSVPEAHGDLGRALFELGQFDDGIALMERSIEELAAQLGTDHFKVTYRRSILTAALLEVGQLDRAAREIAAAEEGLERRHEVYPYVRGAFHAQLLRWRGQLKDAEQLARSAASEAAELHHPALDQARILWSLGTIMAARKHWSEARAPLEQALALLDERKLPPEQLADVQVPLAEVLLELGERGRARPLANAAAAALADRPGHVRARAQLAALHDRLR